MCGVWCVLYLRLALFGAGGAGEADAAVGGGALGGGPHARAVELAAGALGFVCFGFVGLRVSLWVLVWFGFVLSGWWVGSFSVVVHSWLGSFLAVSHPYPHPNLYPHDEILTDRKTPTC